MSEGYDPSLTRATTGGGYDASMPAPRTPAAPVKLASSMLAVDGTASAAALEIARLWARAAPSLGPRDGAAGWATRGVVGPRDPG